MKLELPYLSKITLSKKTSKDYVCFSNNLFNVEELSGDDFIVFDNVSSCENNINTTNRLYISLCDVKTYCKLMFLLSKIFVSKEKIKNNFIGLLTFGAGYENKNKFCLRKQIILNFVCLAKSITMKDIKNMTVF